MESLAMWSGLFFLCIIVFTAWWARHELKQYEQPEVREEPQPEPQHSGPVLVSRPRLRSWVDIRNALESADAAEAEKLEEQREANEAAIAVIIERNL